MSLKIISWNVNGIRAAQRNGFLEWLEAESPDILGIQEVRAFPDQLDMFLRQPDGYHVFWNPAEKAGYAGTALFSKMPPERIETQIGANDHEGRTIIAHFPDFILLTAYFPNGGRDAARLQEKFDYYDAFLDTCQRLSESGKPVLFGGDLNIAHTPLDLSNPKTNTKTVGFLPEERAKLDRFATSGFVDTFRHLHPDQNGHYSWWSQRGNCRARNIGWRLDTWWMSQHALDQLESAFILPHVTGSDHAPVGLLWKT
jgi:exodeoxyribonuclease-3